MSSCSDSNGRPKISFTASHDHRAPTEVGDLLDFQAAFNISSQIWLFLVFAAEVCFYPYRRKFFRKIHGCPSLILLAATMKPPGSQRVIRRSLEAKLFACAFQQKRLGDLY
jgi:hypothetical protein